MDAIQIASITSGCLGFLIILLGTIELIRLRNHEYIRTTLVTVNIFINVGYVLNCVAVTYQAVNSEEPCFLYLWITFVRINMITTGYLVKAWRIFVFAGNTYRMNHY